MKTGYAKVCINPPYMAPIVGYYQKRYVKGILDDLYVRAVAFDNSEKKAVILTIDVCLLPQKYYDMFKEEINKATGIDKDAIYINCSHTHTGPLVGGDFASKDCSSQSYDDFLVSSVRDCAVYALNDLHESEMGFAKSEAKNISFIRRYRMKDGSVQTNPGVKNENIDHPLGTPNETVKLIKITRKDADDIFIVNFGTHADSVGGEYISNDYIGKVCETLERAVPNTKCIFLLGAQGDVNHVNVKPTEGESAISKIDFDGVPRSIEHAEHMGRIIAGAVLSVCSITDKIEGEEISYGSKEVKLPSHQQNDRLNEARHISELYRAGRANELPYKEMELTTVVAEAERIIQLENGPTEYSFFLSALKIGGCIFAGIGGEAFTEIGNRINEASTSPATIVTCLTNSAGGYIPTRIAYEEGGYEARSSRLKPGGDDIIVDGMIELFKEI